MNVQQQIAKLESLLSRIRQNVGRPRATAQVAPAASVETSHAGAAEPPIAEPPEAVAYESAAGVAPASVDIDDAFAKPTVPPGAASPVEEAVPEVEELDMADAEIVEIVVDVTVEESVEAEAAPPLANELEEEPAPESAPRPAAQITADEAELEPPVKTPPPESGRQVVAAPAGISGEIEIEGPGVSEGLEADMSGGPISKAPPGEPTAAQLGETVELDGADGPPARIELLSAPMSAPVENAAPLDDLELSLPQRGFGGGYDAELAPPSRSSEDLARHRNQAAAAGQSAPPGSLSSPGGHEDGGTAFEAASPSGVAPPEALVSPQASETSVAAAPLIVERPAVGERQVAEMRTPTAPSIPATFVELLDASLSIEA